MYVSILTARARVLYVVCVCVCVRACVRACVCVCVLSFVGARVYTLDLSIPYQR